MEVAVGVLVALVVVGLIVWQVVLRRKFAELPPEIQEGITHAKESRKQYRQLTKTYDRRVKSLPIISQTLRIRKAGSSRVQVESRSMSVGSTRLRVAGHSSASRLRLRTNRQSGSD